jgi:type I restriction enzyme S subunit
MKEGWEIKQLGDVCEFVRGPFGGSLKKSIFKETGFAVYEQQHAIYNQFSDIRYFIDQEKFKEMKRFELRPNDLIMSCSGTMGKVAIVPENIEQGIINQALLKLTCNHKLNVVYLKLWMDSSQFIEELEKNTVGAAIKNVASVKVLKTIPIPLPPLPEQQRIVSILDRAFASIDKAQANAEQNLQNAKELFESYLQGVFESKGEGWEEKKLNEIGNAQTGTTPKTSEKENFGVFIPFIKPADVDFTGSGDIRYDNNGLSEVGLKKGRKMKIGSTLMVCIGATIGKVGFAEMSVSCNQQINSLTVKNDYEPKFIYYAMTSKNFQEKVLLEGKGAQATLPIINKSKWENLTINFPKSRTEQKSYVEKFDALKVETQKMEAIYRKKMDDLEELKKSILQKTFAGELNMSELGFDGLKDDRILEKDKTEILQSSNPKNHNPDKRIKG